MNKNKNWFTIIELAVTLFIISIILLVLLAVFPNFIDSFVEQKNRLNFQQSFVLDNFYLNNKISNSSRILENYSSGVYNKNNSYLTLLNNNEDFPYSLIYLWDNNWKILEKDQNKWKIIVKNTFFYSDYVKINDDIYYTNPWEHTIYKYNIISKNNSLVYWTVGEYWYDNSWTWLFNTPTWITYDWLNTIYVSDSWNNLIRSINISNWEIWVLAWNELKKWYNDLENRLVWTNLSESLLDYPTWIVYDNNSIYLSDSFNNRIRKIKLWDNKIYTLLWSDYRWFNADNWLGENVFINWPLSLVKTTNWIIFWDILNWKIRYYDEVNNILTTIIWIENSNNNTWSSFSKYTKNYFNSYISSYWSWFYFNDAKNGIIYNYSFWNNNILWDSDDSITNLLGSLDNNILINWDIENDISSIWIDNDLVINDLDLFYKTSHEYSYPVSWNSYLVVDTRGKFASWSIIFNSNTSDWDLLQIWDRIFEFDDGLLNYSLSNIVIPIWITMFETVNNLIDSLNNYQVRYFGTWNIINIYSNIVWEAWNNIAFSWASLNYSLNNLNNKLVGGIEYNSWYLSFNFINDFLSWEKYKLSFYISSDKVINTEVIEPLLKIKTWTWNIEEKVLNITDKWIKKEFVFNWIWKNQNIEFFIKYWEKIYFDLIKIEPIWEIQSLNLLDNNKFKIWILNSFYVLDSDNFILDNTLDRKLMLLWNWSFTSINNNFSLYDFRTLLLNWKNDYLWSSIIEDFHFENRKSSIIYDIWVDRYNLKISNNIK